MDATTAARILRSSAIAIACVVLVACASDSGEQPLAGCVPDKNPVVVNIRLDAAKNPDKVTREKNGRQTDADLIHVCPGDTVRWVLVGQAFSIEFKGPVTEWPFNWPDGKKSSSDTGRSHVVVDVVRSDVVRDTPLKYDIVSGDRPLDPRIIVDH